MAKPGTFKPGQSGNPRGRPLRARAVIDVLGVEAYENLLHQEYILALSGDAAARKNLLDRLSPTLSRQELTGFEGKPIALEHAEEAAAKLPTDVLRELDALAERLNTSKGNGAATNGDAREH